MGGRKRADDQGDKVSAQVLEFQEQQQQRQQQQQQVPPAPPAGMTVASRGFVPRTDATDREKAEAKSNYDASLVLKVTEDDPQVRIYNDYARGANTTSTRNVASAPARVASASSRQSVS